MSKAAPTFVRALRYLLRRLNYHLGSLRQPLTPGPFDVARLHAAEAALRNLEMPSPDAKAYFERHVPRLARTLALVPPPRQTGRVLELGCYMQITPLLQSLCGYTEVRGAYYGQQGQVDRKTSGPFSCYIDHFDAERDAFPYADGHFDLVIAAEIIEHFTYDPMHMFFEARRALADGGFLLVSTPNVASITSVHRTLEGKHNPQIFYKYKRPQPGTEPEIGHMREYTLYELGQTVKAAGFEIAQLFATFLDDSAQYEWLLKILEDHGFGTENRGQQSWCLAVKRADLPVDRYPYFIYSD